jgi:hypothetical protein
VWCGVLVCWGVGALGVVWCCVCVVLLCVATAQSDCVTRGLSLSLSESQRLLVWVACVVRVVRVVRVARLCLCAVACCVVGCVVIVERVSLSLSLRVRLWFALLALWSVQRVCGVCILLVRCFFTTPPLVSLLPVHRLWFRLAAVRLRLCACVPVWAVSLSVLCLTSDCRSDQQGGASLFHTRGQE